MVLTYWTYPAMPGAVFGSETGLIPPGAVAATALDFANAQAQGQLDRARLATMLMWSPSKYRTPATQLSQLFAGPTTNVAVFIPDNPALGITQVQFKLDTVLVNTENLAPWDYFATDGMGNANRGTFAVGQHTIDAVITDSSGTFTVSASFEVE